MFSSDVAMLNFFSKFTFSTLLLLLNMDEKKRVVGDLAMPILTMVVMVVAMVMEVVVVMVILVTVMIMF